LTIVEEFASELCPLGLANFLYSDGDAVFVHGHKRRHRDGHMRPPGLCLLRRTCPINGGPIQAQGVTTKSPPQKVPLAASVPLTDEPWHPPEDGEIIAVVGGRSILS